MATAPRDEPDSASLLEALVSDLPRSSCESVATFWADHLGLARRWPLPFDRAVIGGASSDRLGYAFLAGYQAALRALFDGLPFALPPDSIVSLCVTEAGGNHPRAIATAVRPTAGGSGWRVSGVKQWATGASDAALLLVIGSVGPGESGRNQLRLAGIAAGAPGVRLEAMPPTPFVPEIPHCRVELDDVGVTTADLLEGDAYIEVVKPFRTVEDVHIVGATLGYLAGVARRVGWPGDVSERLLALIVAGRGLAQADPAAAGAHLALAGLYAELRRVAEVVEPLWARAGDDEAGRWVRDWPLMSVAARAREARRVRAWERIRAGDG